MFKNCTTQVCCKNSFFFSFLNFRLDDIEDSSNLREGKKIEQFLMYPCVEGKPCKKFFFDFLIFLGAYRLFGIPQTINSANYSYFEALLELNKSNLQDSNNLVLEELLLLHKGQGEDIL